MDVEFFRCKCGSAGGSGATEARAFNCGPPKTLAKSTETASNGSKKVVSDRLEMPERRYLGQRISFDGHLCTVRYIGPIKTTKKGDWLGVEWDDPSRGKHDGSHEGERYFQCR